MLSGGYPTKVALVKICYLVQLILQVLCYGMSPILNFKKDYSNQFDFQTLVNFVARGLLKCCRNNTVIVLLEGTCACLTEHNLFFLKFNLIKASNTSTCTHILHYLTLTRSHIDPFKPTGPTLLF